MIRKIAILGSTGSIGKITFDLIKKDPNNFEIVLLTTNTNIKELIKQTKQMKVKNLLVNDTKKFEELQKKFKNKDIKIFNNINNLKKIFKGKIDFTMSSISGLSGLKPTLDSIEFSKTIAIANKESLICAWNLIEKKLKKNKTIFIPVDSEHFSISNLLDNSKCKEIEEVIITASGGPFLNLPKKKFDLIKPKFALKHPTWSMGKKISIDSATLMNKVFEVLEAKKIFNIKFEKFRILTHPNSYVHAIVKFKNGLSKILIHDTDMKIPIFNSLYFNKKKIIRTDKINLKILNNLKFNEVDIKKFPSIKLIKKMPHKDSLYETVLVSANDELVNLFLHKKIKFLDIVRNLNKIISLKQFTKYKGIYPKNVNQILNLNDIVRLKIKSLSIISSS